MVQTKLHSQLLTEAHTGCFGGDFSEKKVYDKICRNYWWYGLRRDVRKFCRSCLTRQGPGHSYRLPMMPIPVDGPFQLLTFCNYLSHRVETNMLSYSWIILQSGLTPDQKATTIAIFCWLSIISVVTEFQRNCCQIGVPTSSLT